MGYLPDAFHAHFTHDGAGHDRFGDVVLRYAVEKEPLGTAGAIGFAAAGIDERIIVCNGDILTRLDLDAMVRSHDEQRRGGDDRAHAGRRPERVRCGADAGRRRGHRVRREASARQSAEQLDQRGHLRARARVPASHPAPAQRVGRAGDVPAHARAARSAVRLPERLRTGSTSGHRRSTSRPTPTPSRAGCRTRRLRARARRSPGVWVQGDATIEPDAHVEAPVLIGDGARVEAGARVHASVLGAGAVVESRAEIDGAVLQSGSRGVCTEVASTIPSSAPTRCSSPTCRCRPRRSSARARRVPSGARISGGRVPAERE